MIGRHLIDRGYDAPDGTSDTPPGCLITTGYRMLAMLKVTYIDFREKPNSTVHSGWYITDASGAIIDGSQRYEDQASGLKALIALS